MAKLCECSLVDVQGFLWRLLQSSFSSAGRGFGGLPRGRRNLDRPRLGIKDSLSTPPKISDFVKGHPYEKSAILINFHGFALNRVILILFTVMIIEKILLF